MSRTIFDVHQQKKVRRIIKRLRLMDDIFFRRCLKDNIPLAEYILRIIMDMPDLKVLSMQVEYVIPNLQGRSVRLDVHAVDTKGTEFDIEMQRANKGASRRRARFNSSLLDLNSLDKGDNFEQLPETYVIFITENDVLGHGLPKYQINRFIEETHEPFNDGEHIIYVNGAYEGDDAMGQLMNDFRSKNPDDMVLEPLKEVVSRYKNNPEEDADMDKELEDWLNEERSEGRAEGQETERMGSIRAIMETAGVTAEKAMEMLKIDKSLWKKYLALL